MPVNDYYFYTFVEKQGNGTMKLDAENDEDAWKQLTEKVQRKEDWIIEEKIGAVDGEEYEEGEDEEEGVETNANLS